MRVFARGAGPMNIADDQLEHSHETSPVDSSQSSSLPPALESTKPCRYCRLEIHRDAKVCQHCRYHQKRYVQYLPHVQIGGLILTIIALVVSFSQLHEARQQRISASEARTEAISAKESATESLRKVEAVAVQVKAAEQNIEGLLAQGRAAEQRILRVDERLTLRVFVNILPDMHELQNPVLGANPGPKGRRYTIGPETTPDQPFQQKSGGLGGWVWTCDDNTLRKLTLLIKGFPVLPYARVARADCLKKEGDSSWKADAERAKILLEKMITLDPHPKELDEFYRFCLSLLRDP
jgi:hypothetical protein